MPTTRMQLKKAHNLTSAAKVDQISVAIWGTPKKDFDEDEVQLFAVIVRVMKELNLNEVEAVRYINQQNQEQSGGDPSEHINTSFNGGYSAMKGNQNQIAEMLLPTAIEGAIQVNETYYALVGALLDHPAVVNSDRVQSAKGTLRVSLIKPLSPGANGTNPLLNRALQLIKSEPSKVFTLAAGDNVGTMQPLLPQSEA